VDLWEDWKEGYGGGNERGGSPPAVRRSLVAADVVGLAPSTCSTSFQDHARRTPEDGGIFTLYLVQGGVVRPNKRSGVVGRWSDSSECQSGLVFLRIGLCNLIICLSVISRTTGLYPCPFMLQYGQLPLNSLFIAKLLSYVAALHYRYFCL